MNNRRVQQFLAFAETVASNVIGSATWMVLRIEAWITRRLR